MLTFYVFVRVCLSHPIMHNLFDLLYFVVGQTVASRPSWATLLASYALLILLYRWQLNYLCFNTSAIIFGKK